MNALLDFRKIERISKALGDPYRLKIIESVRKGQHWMQCSDILDLLNLSQSTVSHHLKQLVDADLLIPEKEGRKTKYLLNKEVFADYAAFIQAFGQ